MTNLKIANARNIVFPFIDRQHEQAVNILYEEFNKELSNAS